MSFLSVHSKTLDDPKKTVNSFRLSDLFNFMQSKGWYAVTASAAMAMYNKNSALADAVDSISSECKSIQPYVYVDKEINTEHEVLGLLKNPNPLMDWSDFMEALVMNRLLTGNAFMAALGNIKFMPNQLWISPTTSIIAQGNGLEYTISARNPSSLNFLDNDFPFDKKLGRLLARNQMSEMLQMSRFINQSTTNGYVADSILSSILYELEILNNGNNHNLSLLLNGVNLSGVFNVDTGDNSAIDQFKEDVKNYFGGSGNAGKYLVSKGKTITFAPIQMTNKDMEQVTNIAVARQIIYDRYQIPQPMRNNNSQTYDNYATAQYVFYDRTILPMVKDTFAALTTFFQKRGVLKPEEKLGYNPTEITALQERFTAELKLKNELNIYTKNELREMNGAEKRGPECDLLYQEFSLVPVGTIPQQQQTTTPVEENPAAVTPEAKARFKAILEKRGYSELEAEAMVHKYYADSN